MRAAVLHRAGEPLLVEEVTLDPPGPGEIRVRVEAAGICHSDYHYMTGDLTCPLPAVLGHEGAGIVEEVGQGVARVSVGERVALMWRPRCGECTFCITGRPVMCEKGRLQATTGGLLDGTSRLHLDGQRANHFLGVSCFAEHVVLSERSVVPVPDDIPARIAAIAGCAVITGVGALLNVVEHAGGRPLLVLGAGGVGLSAVMGARLVGANPILVVDRDPAKLELAARLGATHCVDATQGDVTAQVLDLVPGGVAWAVEAIGRPETLEAAMACLEPGGTTVAVGLGAVGAGFQVTTNDLVQRQKRLIGCLYGSANPLTDLPRIFRLYRDGLLPLDLLLGADHTLDQINEAYAGLAAGSVGRAVVIL